MKAEYIGRFKHRYDDGVDLLYKYRGYEYMICDTHNGSMDINSLAKQHKEEQEKIDKIIEMKKQTKVNCKPTDLNEIFEMLEWY